MSEFYDFHLEKLGEIFKSIHEKICEIEDFIDNYPADVKGGFELYAKNHQDYFHSLDANATDDVIFDIARKNYYSVIKLLKLLRKNHNNNNSASHLRVFDFVYLESLATEAGKIINLSKKKTVLNDFYNERIDELSGLKSKIFAVSSDLNSFSDRLNSEKNELQKNLSSLNDKIESLNLSVINAEARGEGIYQAAVQKFKEKEDQVNEMLDVLSQRAIAGSYENSAAEEKKTADAMRNGSVALMLAVVVIVAVAFFETTSNDFKWENSLFRVTLALLLSVPAGYLARESAKHREQQYSHLQTSLSLKALSPYLATLPEEQQHKIKIEMADRIFAQRDFSMVSKDSFPINMQELAMAIVNKLDAKNIVKPTSVDKNN